jgi:hypothetical protein
MSRCVDMGLSPKQKEGLLNRPTNAHERATNDVRVRKKLAAWLKDFTDMLLVFSKLPPEQLRKELSDSHVLSLSFFLRKSMEVLDYAPIIGELGEPEDWDKISNRKMWEPRTPDRRHHAPLEPVEDADIGRNAILMDNLSFLKEFFADESNPIMDALKLVDFAEDPKLRGRISSNELQGLGKIKEAEEDASHLAAPFYRAFSDNNYHIIEEKSYEMALMKNANSKSGQQSLEDQPEDGKKGE